LNGIHHKEVGLKLVHPFKEVLDAGPCEEKEVFRVNREPFGPYLDLLRGLLAGQVKGPEALFRKLGHDLEEKGGFADARVSADEDHGAGHDPASQGAVEFREAGLQTQLGVQGYGIDGLRLPHHKGGLTFCSSLSQFFDKGIPLAAVWTAPQPLGCLVSAALADKKEFRAFGHLAAPHIPFSNAVSLVSTPGFPSYPLSFVFLCVSAGSVRTLQQMTKREKKGWKCLG
jgi:hypothetical protein